MIKSWPSWRQDLFLLLLIPVWAYGLYGAHRTTEESTRGPDPYADVEKKEWIALAARLEGVRTADFLSDQTTRLKINARFWRAQYALAPTVLRIRYSPRAAAAGLREYEQRYLVCEFSRSKRRARKELLAFLASEAERRGLNLNSERFGRSLLLVEARKN